MSTLPRSQSTQSSQPLSAEFLSTISLNTSTPSQILSQNSEQSNDGATTATNYGILRRCWRYERGCALILPYPQGFLDPIKTYLEDMDIRLSDRSMNNEIHQSLHELEVERLRYVYNDFHRIRLRKIEKNPLYYAYDRVGKEKLSQQELEFAKGYSKLVQNMMKEGLEGLPGKYGFETVQYETPQTDGAALMHYIPENPQVAEFEIPEQKFNLFPNTLIVAPYEECNDWIQRGEFDVL